MLFRALAGFMSFSMSTSRGWVVATTLTDTAVSPRASIARSTTSAMISSTGLVGSGSTVTSLSSAVTSLGFVLPFPECFPEASRL